VAHPIAAGALCFVERLVGRGKQWLDQRSGDPAQAFVTG